jgi:hypothetical protein
MMDYAIQITSGEINYLLGYNGFFDGESRESLGGLFAPGSQFAKEWLKGWDAAEAEARNWKPNPTGAELVREVGVG